MIKEFHPQLLPKIRELAIKANREVLSQTLTGNWLSTIKGRGMEFSDYRQYNTGDDASMIDWKASLRARKILVKELTEEKNLNVYLVIDVSNSMLYGSGEELKAEFAAQIASSIAYASLHAGDSVGLVLYSNKIKTYIAPNIGMRQHNIILNVLSKGESYGGAADFGRAMSQLMGATKQRGMLVIISDFIAMGEHWNKYLELASTRFDIIGLMVRDPRDRRLPKRAGEYVLEDPFVDEKIVIDCEQYWEPYARHVAKEEELVKEYFRMVRGDVLTLEVGQDAIRPIMKFFHRRSLQVER